MRNFPLLLCWEEQKGFQIKKTKKKQKTKKQTKKNQQKNKKTRLRRLLAKVFRNKVPHMNAIICKGSKMCDLY